jgi:hypothetical protein
MKVMGSRQLLGDARHGVGLDRPTEGPLPASPKGGVTVVVGAQLVAVGTRRGAAAGMESGICFLGLDHPAILGEKCVDGALERRPIPPLGEQTTDGESLGVDTRVGSAGSVSHHASIGQPLEHTHQLALDRPGRGLPLPAGKLAAVKLEFEQEVPVHRGEI